MGTTDAARLPVSPALLRLMQLVSPALPIGAYTGSQGLEYAVEAGWVGGENDAREWVAGQLEHAVGGLDAPVLARLWEAWRRDDVGAARRWEAWITASRGAGELRAEDRGLGGALLRLLGQLDASELPATLETLPGAFSLACSRWDIPVEACVAGYLWSWAEAQVAAAVKLVPLGQSAGQRILVVAGDLIPAVTGRALALGDDEIGSPAVGAAMASALHEGQYTRLFRS